MGFLNQSVPEVVATQQALEKTEANLRNEIKTIETSLEKKIVTVEANLRGEIKALDKKIDDVEARLLLKMEAMRGNIRSDFMKYSFAQALVIVSILMAVMLIALPNLLQ